MFLKTIKATLRKHWLDIIIVVVLLKQGLQVSPLMFVYLMTPLVIRLVTTLLLKHWVCIPLCTLIDTPKVSLKGACPLWPHKVTIRSHPRTNTTNDITPNIDHTAHIDSIRDLLRCSLRVHVLCGLLRHPNVPPMAAKVAMWPREGFIRYKT